MTYTYFSDAATFLIDNLGVSYYDLLLLLALLTGFIFMAKDLRIGLIAHLSIFTLCYIGFYAIGDIIAAQKALMAVLLVGVILTLSLFTGFEKTNVG